MKAMFRHQKMLYILESQQFTGTALTMLNDRLFMMQVVHDPPWTNNDQYGLHRASNLALVNNLKNNWTDSQYDLPYDIVLAVNEQQQNFSVYLNPPSEHLQSYSRPLVVLERLFTTYQSSYVLNNKNSRGLWFASSYHANGKFNKVGVLDIDLAYRLVGKLKPNTSLSSVDRGRVMLFTLNFVGTGDARKIKVDRFTTQQKAAVFTQPPRGFIRQNTYYLFDDPSSTVYIIDRFYLARDLQFEFRTTSYQNFFFCKEERNWLAVGLLTVGSVLAIGCLAFVAIGCCFRRRSEPQIFYFSRLARLRYNSLRGRSTSRSKVDKTLEENSNWLRTFLSDETKLEKSKYFKATLEKTNSGNRLKRKLSQKSKSVAIRKIKSTTTSG